LHTFREHAALQHGGVELFSLSEFRTGRTSLSGFRFFAAALRADLDFTVELPFCFWAVAAGFFFFLRGMSETILPHENFWFA